MLNYVLKQASKRSTQRAAQAAVHLSAGLTTPIEEAAQLLITANVLLTRDEKVALRLATTSTLLQMNLKGKLTPSELKAARGVWPPRVRSTGCPIKDHITAYRSAVRYGGQLVHFSLAQALAEVDRPTAPQRAVIREIIRKTGDWVNDIPYQCTHARNSMLDKRLTNLLANV